MVNSLKFVFIHFSTKAQAMRTLLYFLTVGILLGNTVIGQDNQNKKSKKSIGLGLKAGLNFSNVSNASSINASHSAGFMVGGFFSPGSGGKKVMGYRSEIIFSRQGYDFESGSATGTVSLNYILLPQLTTINISKFFQFQLGAQMAFLLNAKADSSKTSATNNPYAPMMDYYNRFDYGAAAGIEINPVKGLLIGARYNLSLANLYKSNFESGEPSFIPHGNSVDLKNNVVQIFAGYRF